ncbi:MAG: hypothetical protein E7523_13185 [Ruminococcaceae bacterium]|nr:hypothetical protein [Oscillospiraceae bacterium]
MTAIAKLYNTVQAILEEFRLYWNRPKPGEYVTYKEIVMLSVAWAAMNMCVQWGIGFGVGNEFTGMTLKMNNNQLLVMGYVCTAIGYITTPLNAWIVDNLRSKEGKYRVYIRLAIPTMVLTILSLWLPYERVRDYNQPYSQYLMIALLFVVGQVQGYIKGWFQTGLINMVHVITPNTQERTKIMSITSIIYSMGFTINNLYYPVMVELLCENNYKYTMTYYRGAYTPVALLAPICLLAFYHTKERLVLPKSRITKLSFAGSMRAVAGNKIFWIKCADGWNDFLEGAKGNVWDWMVYRAHIMKPGTYAILNTLAHNAQFWAMLFSPALIKRFGKRKLKIFCNAMQIVLIAGIGIFLESSILPIMLFIINFANRFVDCREVIDKAIESDMRDNQQYLIGERIDGAFGFIQSYAGSVIGAFTGLFIPWVYKKKGFDGNDYSVLDVYLDYDENKPLDQQTKNPNCVLFPMLKTLISISVVGAAIDVLPWFAYDISETGQKSMIRVIRIRTIVEDRKAKLVEDSEYIEGCDALLLAEKYANEEKVEVPSSATVREAKKLPANTPSEIAERDEAVKAARKAIDDAQSHNEEIEIAKFVMFELHRFDTEFGKAQLELAQKIVAAGPDGFYRHADEFISLAAQLPMSKVKEEKVWRRQDVRNARSIRRSASLAAKHYPEGVVAFDQQIYEDAYNLPDETSEQAKVRRKAMRDASKQRNIYANVAAPYLAAKRIVDLAEGYRDLDGLTADYDTVVQHREERLAKDEALAQKLAQERHADAERRKNERKMRRVK